MKLSALLNKLEKHPAITITEERTIPSGKRVLTFAASYPFPKVGGTWYSMVVEAESPEQEIPDVKIAAMLRHLWMYQLDILPEDENDEN
jgi:hypothetical protein